jgi:hypothetical protein
VNLAGVFDGEVEMLNGFLEGWSPRRRRGLATVLALGVIATTGLVALGAPAAEAAETACADKSVTSVQAVPIPPATSITRYGGFRMDVDFALDPACPVNPGDSFVIHLPEEYTGQAATYNVTDADGNVIGTVVITGDTMTMTYSNFVATHHNVKGSFFAGMQFSQDMQFGQDVTTTSTVGSQTFNQTLNVPNQVSPWHLQKTCAWTDNTQVLFTCDVRFPPGPQTNIHIVDTLGPGAAYVSGSVRLRQADGIDANGNPINERVISGVVVSNESAAGFTADIASVSGPINRITYQIRPTNTTQPSYTNSASFTSSIRTTTTVSSGVNRTVFGGGGQGDNSPDIQIVKKDTAGNDADTAGTVVTLPNGSTGLVYTITNIGNEPLNNVSVTDTVVANGTVTGLTCDFSPLGGPSSGTTWAAGPFNPDASFTCTAQLSGVQPGTTLHEDIGHVTGTGVTSKETVTDDNPYYATSLYSLGDYVWYDTNHDGIQDTTEAAASDVGVALLNAGGQTIATATTNGSGKYHFDQLPAGDYTVKFTAPTGYQWTTPTAGADTTVDSNVDASGTSEVIHLGPSDPNLTNSVSTDNVQALKIDRTIDAGLIVVPAPKVTIVKKDTAGNDADTAATAPDLGYAPAGTGLVFTITNNGNEALLDVTVTDDVISNGTVSDLSCDFSALGGPATGTTWSGPFAVGASFQCTAQLTGVAAGAAHEDVATVNGTGQYSGQPVTDNNPYFATAKAPVQVGDYVWIDSNHNGVQDSGERGVPGVTITLTDAKGNPVTDAHGNAVGPVKTDASGLYHFVDLPAGQYVTHIDYATVPAGLVPTKTGQGTRATDSSTGSATSLVLEPGDADETLDFGLWGPTPQITIVKGDSNGNPADTSDTAPTLPTGTVGLVFRITNTGDEPLRSIVVSDRVVANGTVTGLSCDFSALGGPASGTRWDGPLPVGASFPCTATLSGVSSGSVHHDEASVSAVGALSGKTVGASNPYYAQRLQQQAAGLEIGGSGLAGTGADVVLPAVVGALLIVVGGLALAGSRRRSD